MSTLGTLLSVPILAWLHVPLNYQVVFLVGFLAAMVSTRYLNRLQIPDRITRSAVSRSRHRAQRRLRRPFLSWQAVRSAWSGQPAFNWFVFAGFVFHWGLYAGVPLFPLYWVRELNLTDGWAGILIVAWNGASVLGALLAPTLAGRMGNALLLTVSAAGMAIYPFGTALTRSPYVLLLVCAVSGCVGGIMGVSLFHRLIEVVPSSRRASYVGLYNAVANVAIFAAPLVSTGLVSRVGLVPLLFVSAAGRLIGGLAFGLSRGEAEDISPGSAMAAPAVEPAPMAPNSSA
jgi:MFS family permease